MPTFVARFVIDFALFLGPADLTAHSDCVVITGAAPTADDPWVEVRNTCQQTVSLDETVLRWRGENYGWGATALSGVLAGGDCTLVTRFDQPLDDGGTDVAGLALFSMYDDALTASPSDEVLYCDQGGCNVEAPASGEHIELVSADGWGGWQVAKGSRSTCRRLVPPPVLSDDTGGEGVPPPHIPGPDDWRDIPGDCCDEYGTVNDQQDTCGMSEGAYCVGCDYEPVLCMTHGCGTPGAKDCCLASDGETIAC